MASCGRGAPPRHKRTPEAEEILTDLKRLTMINDRQKDESIPAWDNSFLIPEGGRRRPLTKLTDYKIPKLEGMEPDPTAQSAPKRVGKGRSRIPQKTRDGPLNLGLNREFEMYNKLPCGDRHLQVFSPERYELGTGYRFPYFPKTDDEGHCNSNVKISSYPQFDSTVSTNGQEALYTEPSHTENFNGILPHCVDQFSYKNDFSVRSNGKGNYDDNVPVNLCNANGNDCSASVWSTFHDGQFQDYEDVRASNFEPSSINKLPTALNCANGQTTGKCVPENTRLWPNSKEIASTLSDRRISNSLNKDDCCLSERETSVPQLNSVQPASANTSSILDGLDISVQYAQGSMTKSSDPDKYNLGKLTESKMVPSSAHDWWNDPENETCNVSSNTALHNDQFDDALCDLQTQSLDADNCHFNDSQSNHYNRGSPVIRKAAQDIPTQENQYSSCSIEPNFSPHKKGKLKLTSYNHAQESQSKNGKNLPLANDSQRRRPLGWGDTSYRNALAPYEPKREFVSTTSSVCRAVSVHGNAENSSANFRLNAFMKPIRDPDPVFSMEDDFPALQPSRNINENEKSLPPLKSTDDSWTKWRFVEEDTSRSSPVNDVPPEEPNELSNFDFHSIVIENLPPNTENTLRELLQAFVKIVSISMVSIGPSHTAYVRLENDDNCAWLIDCLDGSIPEIGWNVPLKIRKLE